MTKPKPRKAKLLPSVIISLYGTIFFLFVSDWFNSNYKYYWLQKFAILFIVFFFLYFMLIFRQKVYDSYCKIFNKEIRLFEFSFSLTIGIVYGLLICFLPIWIGMINSVGSEDFFFNENIRRFLIFCGGASACTSVIAGFDIYPVNYYNNFKSLERLADITRDLLKASNRALIVVIGSVIVAKTIKISDGEHVNLSPNELYIISFGVLGVAFGVSGVLGSRLAEILHKLAKAEEKENEFLNNYALKKRLLLECEYMLSDGNKDIIKVKKEE